MANSKKMFFCFFGFFLETVYFHQPDFHFGASSTGVWKNSLLSGGYYPFSGLSGGAADHSSVGGGALQSSVGGGAHSSLQWGTAE